MKFIKFGLLFILIVACSNVQNEPSQQQLIIQVIEIIDSNTCHPIEKNLVRINWLDLDGNVLSSKEFKNRNNFIVVLPADGRTKIAITIDAPGYSQWSQEIRANQNRQKTFELSVKLIPMNDVYWGVNGFMKY
jgi:hypothetical protein